MSLPKPHDIGVYLFVFENSSTGQDTDIEAASKKCHMGPSKLRPDKEIRKGVRWAARADEYEKDANGVWQPTGKEMIVAAVLEPDDAEKVFLDGRKTHMYVASQYYQGGKPALVGKNGLP
jgi:hypothetical protein